MTAEMCTRVGGHAVHSRGGIERASPVDMSSRLGQPLPNRQRRGPRRGKAHAWHLQAHCVSCVSVFEGTPLNSERPPSKLSKVVMRYCAGGPSGGRVTERGCSGCMS